MRLAIWLGKRLVAIVLSLLVVSLLVFSVIHLTPGSPEQALLGTRRTTPEALEAIRVRHHLDQPFLAQYGHWLTEALRLDFGSSIRSNQPVATVLEERVPLTLFLAAYAAIIALAVSIPAGLVAGLRHGSRTDRTITLLSTLAISSPSFVVGFLLLYVFGVGLDWFPMFGVGDGFVDRVWHLTLPAIALALPALAIVARQTRAAAFDVGHQDFVTFARARGLSRRVVWGRYALRNSALPVVTTSGLILAYFVTGALLVETTFAIPGMGTLMVESVTAKDIPVVQALTVVAALFVLTANLAADLAQTALDPRVRKAVLG